MKVLKTTVIVIAVLSSIAFAVILLQPEKAYIERSIMIRGTPEAITAQLELSQSFSEWSPWNKERPGSGLKILTFKNFNGTIYSNIILKQEGEKTRVTWIYEGVNGGLRNKASWLLLKRNIIDQYEEGLLILKELIEGGEDSPPSTGVH